MSTDFFFFFASGLQENVIGAVSSVILHNNLMPSVMSAVWVFNVFEVWMCALWRETLQMCVSYSPDINETLRHISIYLMAQFVSFSVL